MIVKRTVRFTYPRHLLDQPLIYHLIRDFDLVTNILEARLSSEAGWLVLTLRGECDAVQRGIAWMAEQGITVETLSEVEGESCES